MILRHAPPTIPPISPPPCLSIQIHARSRSELQTLIPTSAQFSPLMSSWYVPPPQTQLPYQVEILRHSTDSDSVGSAICERASKLGAALVVLSTHNKGALKEFFVGSVTNYCEPVSWVRVHGQALTVSYASLIGKDVRRMMQGDPSG